MCGVQGWLGAIISGFFLLAAQSCQVVEIHEREVLIEHDAGADTIDMLMVYRGVSVWRQEDFPGEKSPDRPVDPRKFEKARELAERILGGRRQFQLLGESFSVDLDDDDYEKLSAPDKEILADVALLRVEAFLDERDRLSCYQHFRIHGAARLVARLNRFFNEEMAEELDEEAIRDAEYPDSLGLWQRAVRTSWQWLRLEEEGFVVAIPATAQDALRYMLSLLQSEGRDEPYSAIEDVRLVGSGLELVLGTLEDPRFHLAPEIGEEDYEDSLRRYIEEERGSPLPKLTMRGLIAAFEER